MTWMDKPPILVRMMGAILGLPAAGAASPADENYMGVVGTYQPPLIDVVPIIQNTAYTAGRNFFALTEIPDVPRQVGGGATLNSLFVIDKSNQGPAIELYVFSANIASFGAINVANATSKADLVNAQFYRVIGTSEWKTLNLGKIAQFGGLGQSVKATSADRKLYVGGVINSAFTFAVGDLVLRFGFLG